MSKQLSRTEDGKYEIYNPKACTRIGYPTAEDALQSALNQNYEMLFWDVKPPFINTGAYYCLKCKEWHVKFEKIISKGNTISCFNEISEE